MEEARLGRWHSLDIVFIKFPPIVEMEEARLGRWHPLLCPYWAVSICSRNGRSPFRALTPPLSKNKSLSLRRNGRSPFRALTPFFPWCHLISFFCRNGRSPFRALTPPFGQYKAFLFLRRNGRSPFRALTHFHFSFFWITVYEVEMEEARLGRWHRDTATEPAFPEQ